MRRQVAAVAVWLLAAGATAQTVSLRDDRGAEHRFDRAPERIVSLLPSLTESVCALGECARLVGTDRFSNWPPQVAALPKLGALEDPQVERTAALRPDVVLASRSSRIVDRLEALGFAVVVLESDTHDDARRSLRLLARMLGVPDRADRLWAGIEREFADAATRVPVRLRGASVYFEVSPTPHAAGSTSFIGQTLARLGLVNIAPPALGAFPQLNPEFVVRAQPDVVIGPRADVQAMPARPGWAGLRALQHGQVCAFDNGRYELLLRPGPRLGEAARVIADCLAALPAR